MRAAGGPLRQPLQSLRTGRDICRPVLEPGSLRILNIVLVGQTQLCTQIILLLRIKEAGKRQIHDWQL